MSSEAAQPTPTISRVCPDGTLVEALYDITRGITSLAVRAADGAISIAPHFDLASGERLVPYSAQNNLLTTGCVLLPSTIGEFRDKRDKRELVAAVREYLNRYVDLSPAFLDVATHYVLLTWVHDAFNELGYLRFRGDFGTGKTRALIAVGSVCYKPFFASGASTVSPIFHVLETVGATLVLDEADLRFSDATADLTKILNNGTVRGLPVLRTMQNRHRELNPQAFRVFGPKLIAMRERFEDRALESRFLTEETGQRPLRSDIPIHLPESLKADALALRNRLLAWRFRCRATVGPDPSRLLDGVSPRANQTALSLLSIVDDSAVRNSIRCQLVDDEARVIRERASVADTAVLAAIASSSAESPNSHIALSDVARRISRSISENLEHNISPKTVGCVVRAKLRLPTIKSNGIYVIPNTARPAIATLVARYGLDASTSG